MMKHNANQADIDAIIAEVFRLSGTKLTADDPIIPILLVQDARLKALFAEQRISIEQGLAGYAADMDESLKATVEAAEELKIYREQIVADLLAKSSEQLTEAEGRLYSAIQQKIAKQTQEHIDSVVSKMNRSWAIAFVVFCLIVLLLAFFGK